MNKYKVSHKSERTIDNIVFMSKKEMQYYIYLKSLLAKGEISNLILQPGFILQKGYMYKGEKIRDVKYKADFQYTKYGETYIIDVKGFKTPEYKLKRKLFLYSIREDANVTFLEV